eukprot:jgi/Bigna1/140942/aug1.59_g15650
MQRSRANAMLSVGITFVILGEVYLDWRVVLVIYAITGNLAYYVSFRIMYNVLVASYTSANLRAEVPKWVKIVFNIFTGTVILLTSLAILLTGITDSQRAFSGVWIVASVVVPSSLLFLIYYLRKLRAKLRQHQAQQSQHESQMTELEKSHVSKLDKTRRKLDILITKLWILGSMLSFISFVLAVTFFQSDMSFSDGFTDDAYNPENEIFYVGLMLLLLFSQYYAHVPFIPRVAKLFFFLNYLPSLYSSSWENSNRTTKNSLKSSQNNTSMNSVGKSRSPRARNFKSEQTSIPLTKSSSAAKLITKSTTIQHIKAVDEFSGDDKKCEPESPSSRRNIIHI